MVFVDAENVSKKLVQKFYEKHKDEEYRVFGKKSAISSIYANINNVKITYCFSEKNSADLFMTTDIIRSLYEEDIPIYYLLTHDNDFSIAIKTITDMKKEVVVVSGLGKKLSNLKKIGTNLKYVKTLEIDIEEDKYIERIHCTNDIKDIYKMCNTTVWIKMPNANKIIEMPFQNGMPVKRAVRFLSRYRKHLGVGSSLSWEKFLSSNFLKIHRNNLYLYDEDELWEILEK